MKTCLCCFLEKPLTEYTTHRATKDKKYPYCKTCKSLKDKALYEKNKDKKKSQRKQNYIETQDYTRNKQSQYYQQNKELFIRLSADRRANKVKATPLWADSKEIQYYYNIAAYFTELSGGFVKYHVDHIVPLKGKNVCGLHVQNNLQVLKAVDNLRKSNKHGCYV